MQGSIIRRVIHTDLYVDPSVIRLRFPEKFAPGISVAFLQGEPERVDFKGFLFDPKYIKPASISYALFFDAVLRDAPFDPTRAILNRKTVDEILDQPIIVERSPPVAIPFGKLLSGASIITVGTAVGIAGMTGNPLLFAAVPVGILVVGAPIVVLNAIRADSGHVRA
jgi:hypothetical protein